MKRIVVLIAIFIVALIIALAWTGRLASSSCCNDTLTLEEIRKLKSAALLGDQKAIWKLQEDASNRGAKDESLQYLYKLANEFHDGEARYLYFSTIANDSQLFKLKRKQAVDQLVTAAVEGHVASQFFLATYYEAGTFGFEMNKHEALKWYKIASKNGNEQAKIKLKELENGQVDPIN